MKEKASSGGEAEWGLSLAAFQADGLTCHSGQAATRAPITLPLGLRRALCLLVRKARFRLASASLPGLPSHQPSDPGGLSHGPTPTTIPGNLRDPQFLPSASLLLPMPSQPALPPPNTEQRAPRHPAAKGFPLPHCRCLQVRCEDWGLGGLLIS